MASTPGVTVIIPTLNRLDLLKTTIKTFRQFHAKEDVEIVVVDNGTDGSDEWCQKQGVEVLKPEFPFTFGESNNLAAKDRKSDYLLLLNNDMIVFQPFLRDMIDTMEAHPKCAIVGAQLLHRDGSIQHIGVEFKQNGIPFHALYGSKPLEGILDFDRPVNAVTGACMLVRREWWERLHGFDTRFENNYEDIDFCLKARQRECEIWYCHKAVVTHLENQTRGAAGDIRPMLEVFSHKWIGGGSFNTMIEMGSLNLAYSDKRLNLGCGTITLPGFLNIDKSDELGVDIVRDVTKGLPFDSGTIDFIYAGELLEHLNNEDGVFVMNEMSRVLKTGARCVFTVPESTSPGAFQDPTHKTFWNREKITYWDIDHYNYWTYAPSYGIRSLLRCEDISMKKDTIRFNMVKVSISEAEESSKNLVKSMEKYNSWKK